MLGRHGARAVREGGRAPAGTVALASSLRWRRVAPSSSDVRPAAAAAGAGPRSGA